ncbi:hypothetical protein KIW84_012562 [Lathyrus oleraceus]|uniref:Uncharacterized protein n=1 Tax=Pisum sativum TaxID=3888 RepID=A0A9D5BI20_PEA|nr:hypothetical protein KIW84_012562 [Pisum sativum]
MAMFYNSSHQPTKSIKEAKCQNKYSSKTSRAPFTVLAQNSHNINDLPYQNNVGNVKFGGFAPNNKVQGIFLKKDNPRCHINTRSKKRMKMIFSSFVKKVDYAVTHIQDEILAVTISLSHVEMKIPHTNAKYFLYHMAKHQKQGKDQDKELELLCDDSDSEFEVPLPLTVTSRALYMLGDITAGPAFRFMQWLHLKLACGRDLGKLQCWILNQAPFSWDGLSSLHHTEHSSSNE